MSQLSRIVLDIESSIGRKQTQLLLNPSPDTGLHDEEDGSEDENEDDEDDETSNISEVVIEGRPSYMDPLFQNEWISTDLQKNTDARREKHAQVTTQLLDTARRALQLIIPPKEDLMTATNQESAWFAIMQEIFPLMSSINSQSDLLSQYDQMKDPNVPVMKLAAWIQTIALISSHMSQDESSPSSFLRNFRRRNSFPQSVINVIETHILSHDSLLGTVDGLEVALLFTRL